MIASPPATAAALPAPAPARAWILVRCPVHHRVLGEVRGDLRKRCPDCRAYWTYDYETRRLRLEGLRDEVVEHLID